MTHQDTLNLEEKMGFSPHPQTVRKAVQELRGVLSPKLQEIIRRTPRNHLPTLQMSVGVWIGNQVGLWHQNQHLLDSCKVVLGIHQALPLSPDHASGVILESLWESLQKEQRPH